MTCFSGNSSGDYVFPVYKSCSGVILTSVGSHVFLVTSTFSTELNDTAFFYWQKLEKGVSAQELLRAACACYEIDDPALLKKDIDLFLNMCIERQIVCVIREK